MREEILFDEKWMFHLGDIENPFPKWKGPVYSQAKTERKLHGPASRVFNSTPDNYVSEGELNTDRWEWVDLPHDYIIRQTPSEKNNNALGFFDYGNDYGNAWYRKNFNLDEDDMGKRITLFFEAVATCCTVYLNGCVVKHNFCGYNSFEIDISDFVKFGEGKENENVIAVYVTSDEFEGWWYQGAGIYRHVRLVKTDPVAIDLWGVYAMPVERGDGIWDIDAETTVINTGLEEAEVTAVTSFYGEDKRVLAEASGTASIPARGRATVKYSMTAQNPILWDVENPYLYTVDTKLIINGEEADRNITHTGFRTFRLDPAEGLFLNGRHIKLKGVCAHQDFGLTGKAVPDNIAEYKIEMIKEMGANAYRTSHYPHSEATMDAIDRMGLVVMDEARWFSSAEEEMSQLEMLVKRDRNRPSVLFWSIGNEEPHHVTEEGRRICKSMMAKIRSLDNKRVVMTAVSHSPDEATVYDELDAIGVNYNLDKYKKIHEKYPEKCIFASECCATGTTRGWYDDDCAEKGFLSAYDKDTDSWFLGREKTWKFLSERPWVLGEYQWIAFEHRGEAAWPRLCSQSGAIDLYLQKKDAFYQNQSHWTDKPMIHLLPHWNFKGREGEIIKVVAYTNCDEAELFLNGRSLGRQAIEKYGHGEWEVAYEPGELRVDAFREGKLMCSDTQVTTGKAERLALKLENRISEANGVDIAVISCYCTDADGREVPDAAPYVSFNTNSLGSVAGTGSDITDHVPPHITERRMRAGRITVAVRVGTTAGDLKVYAKADGLDEAVLHLPLLPISDKTDL